MHLNRFNPAPLFIRISLCFALSVSFTISGSAQEKLRALVKVDSFPLLHTKPDGTTYRPDTTRIFFTQKNIVYQLNYTENNVTPVEDGAEVHNTNQRYLWLVQDRDSSYGYAFNEYNPGSQKWMHVDSALTSHGMLRFTIDLSDQGSLRRVQSVTEASTGLLHEAYVMKDVTKQAKDTMYFSHSTRMTDIPFTLNKGIDEYTRKKLCYVKLVTGEQYMEKLKATIPHTAITTRFYEAPVSNSEEVMKYIEQFRLIGKRNTN